MARYETKQQARQAVWDRLQDEKLARFPFPPHGRIPNFAGARRAAERLFEHPLLQGVATIKVNPDAPQRFVRHEALRRGVVVLMPTPRLRGGFRRLDPDLIPPDRLREAASLSKGTRWSQEVLLDELPRIDLVVCGSVAVTPRGGRCGKGEGYSDLEYAILRELGQLPMPVMTTVHDAQVVDAFPVTPNDLPLAAIVTPTRTLDVAGPVSGPSGLLWELLDEATIEAMPVLRDLRSR